MRKVTYGAACSIDGFLARSDGSVDWLAWSPDVMEISTAYLARVDTILMGRSTFEAGLAHGAPAMPGKDTVVFSGSLGDVPDGYRLERRDVVDVLRGLKAADGGEICVMGGGLLAEPLLRADLIDEVGLNVHPVLLGAGIPMWRPGHDPLAFSLEEARPIAHGCVSLRYARVR